MERVRSLLLQSLAAGIAGVAGSYAVAGFTPAFVVGALAQTIARVTPGAIVTLAITVLGDLGKSLTVVGAFVLSVTLFAGGTLAGLALGRAVGSTVLPVVVGGVSVFAAGVLLTGAPVASLAAGTAAGVVLVAGVLATRIQPDRAVSPARRRVIGTVGSAFAAVGIGYVFGGSTAADTTDPVEDPTVRRRLAEAEDKSLDIEGLDPLVSETFYEVDINAANPTVDRESWTLSVTGAVEEELELAYEDITAMESEETFNTLRCVGEDLNGRKMDNALWTAAPVIDVLERAGVGDDCCVMLRAVDDYYEEFPLDALRDGLLAYRMNGRPLPRGHGSPVRALIPGHWGEINVKWVDEIEVLERPAEGYWEKRGWHGTGPVNTVAKLHAVNREADRIEVGGHAYAGTRGISAVEVSTDGGATWTDARLSEPLLEGGASGAGQRADDVWRQWVHEYASPGERHEVVVRAREADGTLQPRKESGSFPNGPSGWVSRTLRG